MEIQQPVKDQLNVIASQVRLLAGLMLVGTDLHEVESDAFAQMLKDVAGRLERLTEESLYYPTLPQCGQKVQQS